MCPERRQGKVSFRSPQDGSLLVDAPCYSGGTIKDLPLPPLCAGLGHARKCRTAPDLVPKGSFSVRFCFSSLANGRCRRSICVEGWTRPEIKTVRQHGRRGHILDKGGMDSTARKHRSRGYEAALAYLGRFQFHGFRLGLERITAILDALGNPEKAYPCIQVAGTNGKGSVCALVGSVLSSAGYRVGVYASPHLTSLRERFRIGRDLISEERLSGLIARIRGLVESGYELSYFEYTTAIGLLWFAEKGVDVAVLETGLGGRLDATNVVTPVVSIVTNVALDHQRYLGRTLAAIAGEKAGVIKSGAPVVSAVKGPGRRIIHERCRTVGAPLTELGVHVRVRRWNGQGLHYKGPRWHLTRLALALAGEHQVANAGVAVAACESLEQRAFDIPEAAVSEGLRTATWPGRGERLSGPCRVLLDGAHNMAGIRSLVRLLGGRNTKDSGRPGFSVLLFACSDEGGDKNFFGMLSALKPLFERVVVTEPPGPRAPVTVSRWRESGISAATSLEPDWSKALDRALEGCGPRDTLCVSGSLYLVGAVRNALLERGFSEALAANP